MIGNAVAADAFKADFANKIFRYVDEEDLVPLLPAFSLVANAYGHCLSEVALGAAAVAFVVFGFANSLWMLLLSRLVQGAGGGTGLFGTTGGMPGADGTASCEGGGIGGTYGGGAGSGGCGYFAPTSTGGNGAVRIVWPGSRTFPTMAGLP